VDSGRASKVGFELGVVSAGMGRGVLAGPCFVVVAVPVDVFSGVVSFVVSLLFFEWPAQRIPSTRRGISISPRIVGGAPLISRGVTHRRFQAANAAGVRALPAPFKRIR